MKIILLSGWATAGKDTYGAKLAARPELQPARLVAFADAVKQEVLAANPGLSRDDVYTQAGKLHTRPLLIAHAQRAKALYGDGYWAHRLCDTLEPGFTWIVTDWRFLAELEVLRSRFPEAEIVTMRVNRAGVVPSPDPTEHELDGFPFDHVVNIWGKLIVRV